MAEKGFGVKEINLIGASGTPTIESPNNLNLNAVNVAISTNVSIGGTLTVSGNVSVGGTLTYEDVTNIDSVGVVTAREGVVVVGRGVSIAAGGLNVTAGISTLSGIVKIMSGLDLQTNGTLDIIGSESSSGLDIQSSASVQIGQNGFPNNDYATFTNTGVNLNYNNSTKLATTNTGVTVTGTLTATSFSGSGANLTGIAVTEAPVVDYTITGDGSHYYFHGGGVDETAGDPDLYLIRGQKYRFNNTTGSGHPFRFTSTGNANAAYSNGVTGSENGIQFWTIPYDAPAKLFYVCTIHGGMVGNIYIRGAGGQNDNVGVTTFSGITKVQTNDSSGLSAHFLVNNTETNSGLSMLGSGSSFSSGGWAPVTDAGHIRTTAGSANGLVLQASAGDMRFYVDGSPTERMRIHSNGALSVGTSPGSTYWGAGTAAFFESTTQNTVTISHSGTNNNYPLTVRNNRVNASTGGYMLIFFGASAVMQGSIISNNGSTSYNSGSDYRLKENIVDISDGITRVKQLQPRRFNWISDSNKTVQDGFIAHELQSVVPESTTGTKDEIVNQEGINDGSYHPDAKVGDAVYQSVDYGKMTPLLTAALKELIAKVETLEAKVAALEGS